MSTDRYHRQAILLLFLFALRFCWTLSISTKPFNDSGIRSSKNRHNVSLLLDALLVDYNNVLRPDMAGPPTIVDVDIMVRSMGPISEADMTFSMDCYFRQTWKDTRLAHEPVTIGEPELSLSVSMLNRIWKPDTYFYNGKNSYLHTITSPNKLVRLFPDGRILYSSRLTIKASCPMELRKFPMDEQLCPLDLGSFAYTQADVLYRWNEERQVVIASGMKMSQFDLVSTPVSNYTLHRIGHGDYSMLSVHFNLQRHMGSFMIQVYGPCILLVVLSWVSFWLNREATADRISLGVTTMLTMTFIGIDSRVALPKVAYPTALDHFIFLSLGFVFATVVQFGFVHYFTKHGFGELYYSDLLNYDAAQFKSNRNGDGEKPPVAPRSSNINKVHPQQQVYSIEEQLKREDTTVEVHDSDTQRPGNMQQQYRQWHEREMNSVSRIDQVSRIVFPTLFLTINLFYWYTYTH